MHNVDATVAVKPIIFGRQQSVLLKVKFHNPN